MFHFQTLLPSPPLRDYIYSYLVVDVVDNNDLAVVHEALPMGITTLCFSDRSGCYHNKVSSSDIFLPAPDIAVVGQMVEKGESIFSRSFRSVVALFKPTALYQFGGAAMNAIAGTYSVDATSLFSPKELHDCREQMFQYVDGEKAVDVLDHFLLTKLETPKHNVRNLDKLADYISHKKGNVGIDWLADQASMSIKTLERHFVEKIGLTPKHFARIIRFKSAFQLLEGPAHSMDVFRIIEGCGFTDQAHLIKEFKHFTSRTPKFYYASQEVLSPFFLGATSKK
ncbi:MAG TPA: helix-turn-helix domain-containing protein [Ohtaekwangia sp.]|uniref:helix-turn-helix domain-containing protein n=1 Tax=Ohtaekwangia sp. TaxID=2066019 RepID=UPI002F93C660